MVSKVRSMEKRLFEAEDEKKRIASNMTIMHGRIKDMESEIVTKEKKAAMLEKSLQHLKSEHEEVLESKQAFQSLSDMLLKKKKMERTDVEQKRLVDEPPERDSFTHQLPQGRIFDARSCSLCIVRSPEMAGPVWVRDQKTAPNRMSR